MRDVDAGPQVQTGVALTHTPVGGARPASDLRETPITLVCSQTALPRGAVLPVRTSVGLFILDRRPAGGAFLAASTRRQAHLSRALIPVIQSPVGGCTNLLKLRFLLV